MERAWTAREPRPDLYGGRLRLCLSRTDYDTREDYRLRARTPATAPGPLPLPSCPARAPRYICHPSKCNRPRLHNERRTCGSAETCARPPPWYTSPLSKCNRPRLYHERRMCGRSPKMTRMRRLNETERFLTPASRTMWCTSSMVGKMIWRVVEECWIASQV